MYFIQYNLEVLLKSFSYSGRYIKKKNNEKKKGWKTSSSVGNIRRQSQILGIFIENPDKQSYGGCRRVGMSSVYRPIPLNLFKRTL